MALTSDSRLGQYQIGAQIGKGGMGEVYRALDTNLGRQVAIKLLPDTFSDDADRSARFEREAKMLAALNHPNIAQIYGFEKADGVRALVMELVEGPTLADRIAQGPLPTDEALPIARQIAEALEAAHEQGIVHRDLKPANIKLRTDGTVKVLDFGLAKAVTGASGASGASGAGAAATVTSPAMTHAGLILGTAAYMSPEQARGKPVDRRTDIWAFGCVLYEMLTGRRAFEGEDVSLTLSQILQREPVFDALPKDVPTRVRQALHLCLRKSPKERLPDIGAVRMLLEGAFETTSDRATTPIATSQRTWRRAVPFFLAAVAGAVAAALGVWQLMPRSSGTQKIVRFAVPASANIAPRGTGVGRHILAISPQGTQFVYWSGERLNLRTLDRHDDGVAIRGTEVAREPFFSPDGQWVGFHRDGQLMRVAVAGGAPIAVGAAQNPWGVSWGSDGVIRYGQGEDGIWQVSATGGAPGALIRVEKGEAAHGPQLLPDGNWLLFTFRPSSQDSWDNAQIVVESIASGERIVLIDRGRDGRYLPTGHLVYGHSGVLLGVPFDVGARRVTGPAVALVEGVMDADTRTGAMHYTVSNDGTLVYLSGGSGERSSLSWVDRNGRREPLPLDALSYSQGRVSPDGTRVAVGIAGREGMDIHIFDRARKSLTRLTSSLLNGRSPLWTPDSQRVVFYSGANGGGLYSMAADGSSPPKRLTTSQAFQTPYAWADGGRTLLYDERPLGQLRAADIYALSIDRESAAIPLLKAPESEAEPAVSPDGRWLAYTAADDLSEDVYVRPYPQVDGGRWRISTDGGNSPLWSRDGKRLFFVGRSGAMAVPIETAPTVRPGSPTLMFDLPPFYQSAARVGRQWDITPDGERFLIMVPGEAATEERAQSQIVVVLNWQEELKRLAPTQ